MHSLYRCYDKNGALIYVGASANMPVRLAVHGGKIRSRKIAHVETEPFKNKGAALIAETKAILKEKPRFNVQGVPRETTSAVKIRKLRESRGETQAEFGAHFNIHQTTIHRWETHGLPFRGDRLRLLKQLIYQLAPPEPVRADNAPYPPHGERPSGRGRRLSLTVDPPQFLASGMAS